MLSNRSKALGLTTLILILLASSIVQAKPAKSAVITFRWERSIEIGESSIPVVVSIPVGLTVEGLPDRAKPGERFQLTARIEPVEGAFLQLSGETFNLDEALSKAVAKPRELDLSALTPLTSSLLTAVLEEKLGLPRDAAESMASAVQANAKLSLASDLNLETKVEGSAAAEPKAISTWFEEASVQTLAVKPTAKNGEKVKVSYSISWRLLLKMDLSEEAYNDPTAGPILKRLAQLLGLPLTKELGSARGDGSLTHVIRIYALPRITLRGILLGVGATAAALAIAVIVILKHPRKPTWR